MEIINLGKTVKVSWAWVEPRCSFQLSVFWPKDLEERKKIQNMERQWQAHKRLQTLARNEMGGIYFERNGHKYQVHLDNFRDADGGDSIEADIFGVRK